MTAPLAPPETVSEPGLWAAYRLRWKRRGLLWRAYKSRRDLGPVADRTGNISPNQTLVFMVVRNEMERLPWFLGHYRRLGVSHFLIVDNDSTDGTGGYLADQPDVSLWHTRGHYRETRFGRDWINYLLMRYGHGHWCLTVDADELLVYAGYETHPLPELTRLLDRRGEVAFGALMLDMYPKEPVGTPVTEPDSDPIKTLCWFDTGPYRAVRQIPMQNLWVQGGARERVFFADAPRRSPTLNKLPLVRWNRRWAYVNSTHSMLPGAMNRAYDGPGDTRPCGVLLHTKFMADVIDRALEDMERQQHFHDPALFKGYYEEVARNPVMFHSGSCCYDGPSGLVDKGLMGPIDW